MIIYNVTVNIEEQVESDWKNWMLTVHIPDVMNTGFFAGYKFCRLLHDEPQGVTYAIQYYCPSMDSLNEYLTHYAPDLQAEHTERFKSRFVAFRTLLKVEDQK